MSAPVVMVAAVTVAAIAITVVTVVVTVRRDAGRNVPWTRAHESRLARWTVAARSGRGDTPPSKPPLALSSGRTPVREITSGPEVRS